MAESGFVTRDVPDTLWICCSRKDSPITKDRAKFRACFTDWMLPFKFEIVEFKFLPGFAWGTVRMKTTIARSKLLEHAKKKPFLVDGDTLIVKSFELREACKVERKSSNSSTFATASTYSDGARSTTPKFKKGNVAENILKSKDSSNSSSPKNWRQRCSPEPVAFDSRPFPTRKRSTDIYERFSELENLFTDVYKTSPAKSASNDDEAYRKKLLHAAAKMRYMSIGNLNSPLKGTKVVVSNLAPSVNWEDMVELFSDIGNLKVVKMTEPGSAEVVFYNREDALKSVRVYHRRDLDGRYMQVSIREQSTESSFGNQTDNETNRTPTSSSSRSLTASPSSMSGLSNKQKKKLEYQLKEQQKNQIEVQNGSKQASAAAVPKSKPESVKPKDFWARNRSAGDKFTNPFSYLSDHDDDTDKEEARPNLEITRTFVNRSAAVEHADSRKIFVGNLPHYLTANDLKNKFGKYGEVEDAHINIKGLSQGEATGLRVPNFGFVFFKNESSVTKCLSDKPIFLKDGHRINVEIKKPKPKASDVKRPSFSDDRVALRLLEESTFSSGKGVHKSFELEEEFRSKSGCSLDSSASPSKSAFKKVLSKSETKMIKQFSKECVQLLKHSPHSKNQRLDFKDFVPAYHQYFGRQCKLSDYGFSKLIDLIESIDDVIKIQENRKGQKILKLAENYGNQQNLNGATKDTNDRFEPTFQTSFVEPPMAMTSPIPHDDVDDITNNFVSSAVPYSDDDLLDDDYVLSSDEDDFHIYHRSSSSSGSESNERLPNLVTVPPFATSNSSIQAPSPTKPTSQSEASSQVAGQENGENNSSMFTGGVRCVKGQIVSCKKSGTDPKKPLEVQTLIYGRTSASIFISPSDIKNSNENLEAHPSKLVGQYVMVHLAGQGEGVFLFAELYSIWDQINSEAIDKAISVLMNYFEWSLKDPKSSELEYKGLVVEIHHAKDARDITDLVRLKLASAAEKFSKVSETDVAENLSSVPKTVAKVEVFDDSDNELERDLGGVDTEMTSLSDVLMPLAPGKESENYESIFVLPKEQSESATNDSPEQNKNGASKKSKKRSKNKGSRISGDGTASNVEPDEHSDANQTVEELELRKDIETWLINFYFSMDYDTEMAEKKAMVVLKHLTSATTMTKLLQAFKLTIDSQGNLVLLCSKIADLFEDRDKQNVKLWPDVHPVLTYLVSRYFPATVVPVSVRNGLKSISFRSYDNTNKYQCLGVIEEKEGNFLLVSSAIGYILADLNQIVLEDDLERGQMVTFSAWKENLLESSEFPTFVASHLAKFFDQEVETLVFPTIPKLLTDAQRTQMLRFLTKRNINKESSATSVFEQVVTDLNSRPLFNRLSINTFLINRALLDTYSEVEAFWCKKPNINIIKIKLYTSIWARLGFTASHLETDYRHLFMLGGRSCVENSWLSLLYLVRLPKNVNPVELVRLTLSFFDDVNTKVSLMDFGGKLEDLSIDRSHIEDLIAGLQGKFRLPKPIVLPPVIATQRAPGPAETSAPYDVNPFLHGSSQEITQQQQQLLQQLLQHQQQQPTAQQMPIQAHLLQQQQKPSSQQQMPIQAHLLQQQQQPSQQQMPLQAQLLQQQHLLQQQQQQLHQNEQALQRQHQIDHLLGSAAAVSNPLFAPAGLDLGHFQHNVIQEVKVQSEHGEIYKFSVNENGDLPVDIIDALCSGTRALKYKTSDQTWRIITKLGNVFPQPAEGWADRVYTSIAQQGQQQAQGARQPNMAELYSMHQMDIMGFSGLPNPFLGHQRPF